MARSNYARFYALLSRNPHLDKDDIELQYTDGRTTHLHEMKQAEYEEMCDMIEYGSPQEQAARERELRCARSSVLLRIGRLGISTVDNWSGIDSFCLSPKVAGKRFAELSTLELRGLVPKLESILRKGGLKSLEERPAADGRDDLSNIIQIVKCNNTYKS